MKRLMNLTAVICATSLSRSQIYRLEKSGAFPKRINLTEKTVAWDSDEIAGWITAKLATKGVAPPEQAALGERLVAAKRAKRIAAADA